MDNQSKSSTKILDKTSATFFAEQLSRDMKVLEKAHDSDISSNVFHAVKIIFQCEDAKIIARVKKSLSSMKNVEWFMMFSCDDEFTFFFNRSSDRKSMFDLMGYTTSVLSHKNLCIQRVRYFSLPNRISLKTYCCWKSWKSSGEFYRWKKESVIHTDKLSLGDDSTEEFLFT